MSSTPDNPVSDGTPKRANGLSDEQVRELLAAGRRKNDPSMDRLMEEAARFREKLRLEKIVNQEREERNK